MSVPVANHRLTNRSRIALICLGTLVILGAVILGAVRRERNEDHAVVNVAIDQLFVASHNRASDFTSSIDSLERWRARFSHYDARVVYRGPDRATVSFWNKGVLMGRQDLQKYSIGWMPHVPGRRKHAHGHPAI